MPRCPHLPVMAGRPRSNRLNQDRAMSVSPNVDWAPRIKENDMDEVREVMMKVDGLREAGRADAVRRTIRGLDAGAQVQIDLERGQINVTTRLDTLEVIDALT